MNFCRTNNNRAVYSERGKYGSRRGWRRPTAEMRQGDASLLYYVSGSLNVFNHRTNVDISNRIVCYDIKELGKQLKKLGMLIVQDQVWGRVTANRAEGKATRYYMDEFHCAAIRCSHTNFNRAAA